MLLESVLHAGTEHPNLVWVLVPSFLSFLAGTVVGARGLHRHLLDDEAEVSS